MIFNLGQSKAGYGITGNADKLNFVLKQKKDILDRKTDYCFFRFNAWGSWRINSLTTVNPPTPESKTPIGLIF
jgi:hypothetical protein